MTLFKQMAIAISIMIIILLSTVMVINFQSSKKDMIQNLYENTVNNISTLTSKLAEAGDDSAIILTTVDSEFDSGYYKMIDFKSNDGKSDYKQIDNKQVEGIPLWFVEFTNIQLDSVTADVSSGWTILGVVTVQGDTGIVYKALYKMFLNLSYIFIIAVAVSLIILNILLRFILKPIFNLQHQAESILKNEFIIQDKVPFTTELKDVVKAMNTMVNKVEIIFDKANETVKKNQELLYNDPITKLYNRRYLMIKLPNLLKELNKNNGGSIIMIALSGAEIINQSLGRRDADNMFLSFANHLRKVCNNYPEKVITRVNGTEFVIVVSDCGIDEASDIVSQINEYFDKLLKENEIESENVFINLGIYKYKPDVSIGDLLTKADTALITAKSKENENIHLYEEKEDNNALGKDEWRKIIENTIIDNHFVLNFWTTLNAKKHEITHKVMTFIINNGKDKKYFYGDFIAPAINLGLASKMYLVALEKLLSEDNIILYGSTCSIRMQSEFINDPNSFEELEKLFSKYIKKLNFKLSFEVTDSFAIHHTQVVKQYASLFSKYGFGFGINSFTGESKDYSYLKTLNPEFLKSDCSFLLDQPSSAMAAIHAITDSLGIEIIATFVKTKDELDSLASINIDSIQGPITDVI